MAEQIGREAELQPRSEPKINLNGIEELVTDKGYHSGAVVQRVKSYAQLHSGEEAEGRVRLARQKRRAAGGVREPAAGAGRVRKDFTATARGADRTQLRALLRDGGMRRCLLRGRENILKRQLVHVGAFNRSLILRKLLGAGTPREAAKMARARRFRDSCTFCCAE